MSNSKTHNTGQILNVYLPTRDPHGREQVGIRPCVLIADPSEIQSLRFPLLIIAPMTTRPFVDLPLYPRLERGAGGLPMDSTVLLDQLLAVDTSRVRGYIGTLSEREFTSIKEGLSLMFPI